VEITQLSLDDDAAVGAVVDVLEAVRRADCPAQHPHTARGYAGMLRHGWDGEPPTAYAGRVGGEVVGVLTVDLPMYDNTGSAWLELEVHPAHRRKGYGTALLEFGLDVARSNDRRTVGSSSWDLPAPAAFAARHGFERKLVEVMRRQVIAEADWDTLDKLYDDALGHSADYELLRLAGPSPDDLLDAIVTMTAAINDAPLDDLDWEDEVFTPERVRAFETAMAGRDRTIYRVAARHKQTGELGGHSQVAVEHERPEIGWQLDTAVLKAHRGHRLGLLLKIDVLRWLCETEPQLATVDTWNAESNTHMVAVNEALGYHLVARAIDYQREI
jgi:GNAT superfamily N-acetyltransferase